MRRTCVLLLVLALPACGGEEEPAGTGKAGGEAKTTVAGAEANDHGTADVTGQTAVDLELDDFYFEPTILTGEAGQALTLQAANEGDVAHTLTIDALGVDVELEPGAAESVDVTLPASGALLVYCRFHAEQGMRAGLSVGGDRTAVAQPETPSDEGVTPTGGVGSYPGYGSG